MKTRAARLLAHGEPLQITDIELPAPGEGELLVRLAFAGVNPVDHYAFLGRVAPDGPLPRTLGGEASGYVGERPVVVRGHGLGMSRDGLWAGAAVVPAASVIDLPEGVGMAEAAAVGVAGVTAWRCLTEKAAVSGEDRVLVLAASGGVGSVAVSIAAGVGARVWGQTTDAAKVDWIAARGAERVVVADAAGLVDASAGLDPTVVVDPLGGAFTGAAITAMHPGGRLVLLGTSAGTSAEVPLQALYRKGITVAGYGGLIEPDDAIARGVRATLRALAAGRAEIVVDRVVPLEEAERAFELIRSRTVKGKVVLDVSQQRD